MNADVETSSSVVFTTLDPDTLPLDQRQTPFLDNLIREKNAAVTSFHMPGHKGRLAVHPDLIEYWGADLYPADLIESNGSIDYLHSPQHTIIHAQKLAAQAYGADHTFFLLNGSTVGNQAALMSVAGDGDKVIVSRAAHRSVYAGLIMTGATPIWIEPTPHPEVGFAMAVRPETVRHLLEEHPDAVAVHVTSPNYYGCFSDVRALAQVAHEYGAVLIVDSAHGAHLAFHPDLPDCAVSLGADLVVMSTHKTIGALTQCSMLHVNGDRVNCTRVAQVLGMLQSSSPSSILLASLDAARMQMAVYGQEWLGETLRLAHKLRAEIHAINGLWVYGEDLVGSHGIYAYDPTKLLIRVSDLGMTGFQMHQRLRADYGIDPEFADLKHIVCSVTIGDDDTTIAHLLTALRAIAANPSVGYVEAGAMAFPGELPTLAMTLREATFAPSRRVSLERCLGEICAESVIPYPPGIPLILPGEVIEREHLDYLMYITSQGMHVVGPEDTTLETVRVVDDSAAQRAWFAA